MAETTQVSQSAFVFLKRYRWWIIGPVAVILFLIAAAAITLAIISPTLTRYLEGPNFRAEIDKQTSRGLHFDGKFGAIRRTGFDTAEADEFGATDGVKAMTSLTARGVAAKFNPWGVLWRRWQLDYVRIKTGEVEVQTYEPKQDRAPPKPWYAIFLPDRVYLREVTCDTANVKWRVEGRPGGIFGTRVRITPHGRDFEYRAKGGMMRMGGLTPELNVENIHMLITKTVLRIYELKLFPDTKNKGSIRVTGEMGMRDDRHVDFGMGFDDVPIAPWLPEELSRGVRGLASGDLRWKGTDPTIEASSGSGQLRVKGGELIELPLLEFLASAAAKRSLKTVTLSECEVKFRWKYPRFEIVSIDLAGEEKVALRGSLAVTRGALSGDLDVGIAPLYLDWLPKAKEQIFNREEAGLIWTKVRLSGTLREPVNDLTPRLAEALRRDPAAAAGLFLRGAGEWIEQLLHGR